MTRCGETGLAVLLGLDLRAMCSVAAMARALRPSGDRGACGVALADLFVDCFFGMAVEI